MQNLKPLDSLYSWAGKFESKLVANPEDRFFLWHGSFTVWLESLLGTLWVAKDPIAFHADWLDCMDVQADLNIGIQHIFLCINICCASREVLKSEPERQGFQHLPRGPSDVNVPEKHVWSLLLYKTHFVARKLWRKCFENFFSCACNGTERHVTCKRFENAASRAKTNAILSSQNYVRYCVHYWWWRQFLWQLQGPGMLIRKIPKSCINSTWIAMLTHGFVPVKTWLLILCDTAFHAIISVNILSALSLCPSH